ncbi:leucine-rich repeat protein, putative [Bodo saltans]|uniref:Leucine-rich repeat protein, putative n=1 Tax=Bodo saltans TaxID=75058 RepID=A0A0S4JKB1_BODSA|nr:leucine-rich repeat protein, putative [Bodo saltans]|eukprot:CUG91982.1 leucine-rich repeat protein, putative [Bodo saltans]
MVCVAEEAVEGTSNLTKPEGWVAPVLAVIRFVSSTTMSTELLILAVDILNFTISCGCSYVFVEEGGVAALAEALHVIEALPEHREVVIRVLKLLNPQTLLKQPERKFDTSLHATADDAQGRSGHYIAFMESEDASYQPPKLLPEHSSQILAAMLSVFERFSALEDPTPQDGAVQSPVKRGSTTSPRGSTTSPRLNSVLHDENAHFVEVCGVMLFAVMRLSFVTCSEEGACEAFCRVVARTQKYWLNKVAMKSVLSMIQSYLSSYHAYQKETARSASASPPRDIFADEAVVNNVQSQLPNYKLTSLSAAAASSAMSPNFYRPIMEPGILAVLAVSLRTFFTESVGSNTFMANVYRLIHLTCLTEPAKRFFLRGCPMDDVDDDDDEGGSLASSSDSPSYPEATALVPCLLFCLSRTTQLDHQRYCTAILTRLCRGSPKEFGGQMLGQLPPGTVQMAAAFQKGPKLSIAGSLLPGGGHQAAVSPSARGIASMSEDQPTPVGAVCRFLAKRLGVWNPQLIPVVLGLLREVARYFTYPYSRPSFHRGGCESLFAAIQSCVTSFSTDPNIVASGCVVLGLLCRCPHTYNSANINTAPSGVNLNKYRSPFQEEVNTSGSTLDTIAASSVRGRSVSITDHSARMQSLLRYALEHDAVDLAISLSHGQFAETRTTANNASPRHQRGNATSPTENPNESGSLEPQRAASPGNEESDALVLTEKLPVLVKAGLAMLSASLSQDEDVISTLHEEGLVAVMQYICDLYSNHMGPGKGGEQHDPQSATVASNVGSTSPVSPHESPSTVTLNAAYASPQRNHHLPTLLSREDREFVRRQLQAIRLFDTKQRIEEKKLEQEELRSKQRGLNSLSTTNLSQAAAGSSNRRTDSNLAAAADAALREAFFMKQRATLRTEFDHRRLAEVEDELHQREALKSMFLSRTQEIDSKQTRAHHHFRQERIDFETRFMESRKQIEQFQSEQFMEHVSYSHKSLQKKLTAAVRSGHRMSTVSPQAPSLARTASDASQYFQPRGPAHLGETYLSVFEETAHNQSMVIADQGHPSNVPPQHRMSSPTIGARQTSPRGEAMDSSRPHLTASERDAMAQLELLRLELGIQNATGLASIMQTITATYTAVKQLQAQQEAMSRELSAPPSELHQDGSRMSYQSGDDIAAHRTPQGRHSRPPSRPMSAPNQRAMRRQTSRPPSATTVGTTNAAHTPHEDAEIYEDRSPSPVEQIPNRAIPATPPPRTRPTSASTFRLQYGRHPNTETMERKESARSTGGITICPQGGAASIAAELDVLIAEGTHVAVLDLNHSYLGDHGILCLVPHIAKLAGLRELHLQRNGISTASLVPLLADAIAPHHCLEVLDLSNNRDITPRCGRDLLAFLKAVTSVRELRVEGTQLFVSTRRILDGLLLDRRRL